MHCSDFRDFWCIFTGPAVHNTKHSNLYKVRNCFSLYKFRGSLSSPLPTWSQNVQYNNSTLIVPLTPPLSLDSALPK